MLGVLSRAALAVTQALTPMVARAQDTEPAHAPAPPPWYEKLRFDEDYSYLRDPANRADLWDPLKHIPISRPDDWYLSVGGEARLRFEYYNNYRWNPDAADQDGYLLQRYLLHADLHLGESVRLFGQLQASLEDWRAGGPAPHGRRSRRRAPTLRRPATLER